MGNKIMARKYGTKSTGIYCNTNPERIMMKIKSK